MNFGGKIRALLFVLACCCFITAISLHKFNTEENVLSKYAGTMQKHLWSKEETIKRLMASERFIENAQKFTENDTEALAFIEKYRSNGINLLIYNQNELVFWSSTRAAELEVAMVPPGSSVVNLNTGYFEALRKDVDNFTFVFLISLQNNFPKENLYFNNRIDESLLDKDYLTIANFYEPNAKVYNIENHSGELLFSVKLKNNFNTVFFSWWEVIFFIAGVFILCLLANSLASWMVKRGHVFLGFCFIALFFAALRFSDLEYGWLNNRFNLNIFNPKIYSQSYLMPSLGDFLLNTIALTWVLLFVYNHKSKIQLPAFLCNSRIAGWLLHILLIVFIGYCGILLDDVFFGLISNSKINFDIINILNLSTMSWVSIIILCLVLFQTFLLIHISTTLSKQLKVNHAERLYIFLGMVLLVTIYRIFDDYNVFYLLYAILLFIIARNVYLDSARYTIGLLSLVFLCLSLLISIKYIRYKSLKERSYREALIIKAQSLDDPNTVMALHNIERQIADDYLVNTYFNEASQNKLQNLKTALTKRYFDDYLAKYDLKVYDFSKTSGIKDGYSLATFQGLVQRGTVKVSNYFYRINDTFGFQHYFGIIPVLDKGNLVGTFVIELVNSPTLDNSRLPNILSDAKVNKEDEYAGYSMAFYNNDKLVTQSGAYSYPSFGRDIVSMPEQLYYVFDDATRFTHLVFKPKANKMIVISKEKIDYIERLAAISFFFIVIIFFTSLLYALVYMIKWLDTDRMDWFSINRLILINSNKILYKTRIQASIVLSVVTTLVIIGYVNYFYIAKEYKGQEDVVLKDKIRKVKLALEKSISNKAELVFDDAHIAMIAGVSDTYSVDINMFDTQGNLLFSTYPKIYQNGFATPKMPPAAYISIHTGAKSEFVNLNEKLGSLVYSAGYSTLEDKSNNTMAYIGLPNYSNQEEYNEKIDLFLSNLINVYALIFVAIGVLAVLLANQITAPLTFIQESFARINIRKRNERIVWKRQDEIGALIKSYNAMMSALEESALRLAESERESAWREMAKQVAHEIKNPLTPLKLGVQLLERSWKENDPKFEDKFKRFTISFIEQIESLSKIASEFSNFAKMPDTNLQPLDILPVVEQAKEVFNNTSGVDIVIVNTLTLQGIIKADRDQLLRSFNNLFKNAIEARKGHCTIEVRMFNDSEYIFIDVQDNGKGIPEDFKRNIFRANFTTKTSGTGLGLAFVKQAVENAGGTVRFTSTENMGTTFYMQYPIFREQP